METRLDRLFILLDTGSTPLIRKSAATQLGEIYKLYPHKLKYLLDKILALMRSKTWETRVASGLAVESIARHIRINPEFLVKQEAADVKYEPIEQCDSNPSSRTPLHVFDVSTLLQEELSLFSGDATDFDIGPIGMNDKELIQRQKNLLNKKLGLDCPAFDDIQLFDESDLQLREPNSVNICALEVKNVKELLDKQLKTEGMSVREMLTARRKAALQLKRQASASNAVDNPAEKKMKIKTVAVEQPESGKILVDSVPNGVEDEDNQCWPLSDFCEILCSELFNIAWEIRHGAATLLREVVKQTGSCAGVISANNAQQENLYWLESCAVRLICVLALDRFGDYISDEVVAPVRETCAQTLGSLCHYLPTRSVQAIMFKIQQLLIHPAWEIRYGALLGLKYIIAVRTDMVNELEGWWALIEKCLQDEVDDVRAVAATCLLPVVGLLSNVIGDKVDTLIHILWTALLDLDDLTSSTHSVMSLLSALLTADRLQNFKKETLVELIPRIWPFLSHNIANVRKAALNMLSIVFSEFSDIEWLSPVLLDCFRHIFQRCLVESDQTIANLAEQVWISVCSHVSAAFLIANCLQWIGMWIYLLMQPSLHPIDQFVLIKAIHHRSVTGQETVEPTQQFISGPPHDKQEIRNEKVLYTRLLCARCLGRLLASIPFSYPENSRLLEDMIKLLDFHLRSRSATQRLCTAYIVSYWLQFSEKSSPLPELPAVNTLVLACAEENLYYDEVASLCARLQTECKDFLACLKQQKAPLEHLYPPGTFFTIEMAQKLATDDLAQVQSALRKQVHQKFNEHAQGLLSTVNLLNREYSMLNIRVQMALACALISLNFLPPSLNPVIRPLMEAIKKESYVFLRNEASNQLCTVLRKCVARVTSPNVKVFKNLCTFLCSSEKHTPNVDSVEFTADDSSGLTCDSSLGIISLFTEFKQTETKAKRGPKPKKSAAPEDESESRTPTETDSEEVTADMIQYEGSSKALWIIVSTLSTDILNVVPSCRDHFLTPLITSFTTDASVNPQTIVNVLQVLQVVFGALPQSLQDEVLERYECLLCCVKSKYSAVRHMASKAIASCAFYRTGVVMNHVLDYVLPLLGASHETSWRQGSIESVYHIIEKLSVKCIPYIILMVVPVLGRMTDQDLSVQMMASQCFASLIKLMPLEGGVPDPPEMKQHLLEKKLKEREFLSQLLSGNILQNYGIPIPIKADLRKYQQDGVNWLAFLNKYKLHGILCDDMGLGKTLQTICIVAGDHFMRKLKYKETADIDCVPLPSLVVCPSTLCGHWVYEVKKFVSSDHLCALNYSALPSERMRLREDFGKYSLVVASYEIVRNDIDFLKSISWNYCILDEGHVIKNAKSKTTQAVKKLSCNHRLILTGTPVQNNVLELWSLFDFLMPGYLGTERQFSVKYSHPILQSRDARSSSKEQEAGALAVESLHKQVLPFMLRRLKSDVLQDLPPKIIQDYYCDLSPLQVELYREFGQSSAGHIVEQSLSSMTDHSAEKVGAKEHIFQALQYLKKVCNHPALVLQNSKHPKHEAITKECKSNGKSITGIEYSGKLSALKQLLLDCGIGPASSESNSVDGVVNQHRALVFCQLKMTIDIIESELLKKLFPSVTYLRLDGSTPTNSRYDLVNRFNDDPSIDLLLLTTTVGGLGLNLTGADTVIFVEHDWNPMKDLQAMDRAHRIGQTRVVNVYRLITRNTLEEKIMGLQKFKMNIANTIVNQENAGLSTMGTDQLLDLFTIDVHADNISGSEPSKGLKAMLQDLTEVWDESEYDSEYNVGNFLASLAKK